MITTHDAMFARNNRIVIRFANSIPRVHGGFATVMEHIIITPVLDEVVSQIVRFPAHPIKFRIAT